MHLKKYVKGELGGTYEVVFYRECELIVSLKKKKKFKKGLFEMEISHLEALSDAPNPGFLKPPCHLPGTKCSGDCGSQTLRMQ